MSSNNDNVQEMVDEGEGPVVEEEGDTEIDQAPVFVDPNEAVEVQVDDDDAPMEEEEEDGNGNKEEDEEDGEMKTEVEDMAMARLETHAGPVYAVASFFDATTQKVTLVTGGGDDRAFVHHIMMMVPLAEGSPTVAIPTTAQQSHKLEHAHTDSVSTVALNTDYVSDDLTKTPRLAAVGAYDGAILLYDPDTGAKVHVFEGPTDVEWAAFHPKGGSVLLVGSAADNTVWMYHIPMKKCLQVFVGHEASVTAGDFTPDGRWALSASSDGSVRVWAPRTGACKHVFRFHNVGEEPVGLTCMSINGGADGQLVVVGAEDGQAHVCHIGSKKVVASVRHTEGANNAPAAAASIEDEDEVGGSAISVEAVGFSPQNPNWLATGGVDGVVKIWDLANGAQCRQTCRVVQDGEGVTRLCWHPLQPLVFTASTSGTVRLWDARNGSLLSTMTGHVDVINDLSISYSDGGNKALISTASDDKTVRLFQLDVTAALQAAHSNP